MKRLFPNAYYASAFIVSTRPDDESVQRAIRALNTPQVVAGANRPSESILRN